jgi:hypothetical protein
MTFFIFSTPFSTGLSSPISSFALLNSKAPEMGVCAEVGRVPGATRFHTVTRLEENRIDKDTPQISSSTRYSPASVIGNKPCVRVSVNDSPMRRSKTWMKNSCVFSREIRNVHAPNTSQLCDKREIELCTAMFITWVLPTWFYTLFEHVD